MNKFKKGDIVKIVNKFGGCEGDKCFYCFARDTELTILKAYDPSGLDRTRTIYAVIPTDKRGSKCHFDPRDLEPIKVTNWRKRIGKL